MPPQVLLIASPWRRPGEPSLGAALLREVLRGAGVAADVLHAALLYPRLGGAGQEIALGPSFLDRYGSLIFAPAMARGPAPGQAREAILDRYVHDQTLGGVRCTTAEGHAAVRASAPWMAQAISAEISRACQWVERAAERVLQIGAPLLGFSVTFESQLPATIALCERLRARRPGLRIMLGGAACQAEQADGLIASFPWLDAVCAGEGEAVIVPLSQALLGEGDLAAVPGIVYRDRAGQVRRTPAPPLVQDLDRLPVPRYDDFFAQLQDSEWRDAPVRLPFETSRGCWWGQKHLCTFCGLNGEGLAFRAKSPERAYDEIRALYEDYPGAEYLVAADNIIAMPYFTRLLPRLAEMPRQPGRPLQIFYEIKSNLLPEQVALLRAAGIATVQPGIESFSDGVLRLMDKGATGLGQLQFLKWAQQAGVSTTYNLLLRNPGESAAFYQEMLEIIPALHHLPPPDGVVLTEVERFSMYHRDPARYGLANLRPHAFYRQVFPDPKVDVDRIAYQFEYDHPIKEDAALRAAHRALCDAVDAWRLAHAAGAQACYFDRGDHLLLVDRRRGEAVQVLGGVQAALYRYLDRQRPLSALRLRFPALDEGLLHALLERWHREGLIASLGGHFLALLPRRGPAAAQPQPAPPRRGLEVRA